MSVHPNGPDLLSVARRTLLEEVLPLVPPDAVYPLRMVAAAIAIVERELAPPAHPDERVRDAIHAFLQAKHCQAADTEDALAGLIRERRWDATDAGLYELLLEITRIRLAASNPKYLRQ